MYLKELIAILISITLFKQVSLLTETASVIPKCLSPLGSNVNFAAGLLSRGVLCFALRQPHRTIYHVLYSLAAYKDWAQTICLLDW